MRCLDADSYSQKWLKDVEGTIYRENNLEKLQKWLVNWWVFCIFFCPKPSQWFTTLFQDFKISTRGPQLSQLSSSPCQGLPQKVWVAYGTAQWWAAQLVVTGLDPTGSLMFPWCSHQNIPSLTIINSILTIINVGQPPTSYWAYFNINHTYIF